MHIEFIFLNSGFKKVVKFNRLYSFKGKLKDFSIRITKMNEHF